MSQTSTNTTFATVRAPHAAGTDSANETDLSIGTAAPSVLPATLTADTGVAFQSDDPEVRRVLDHPAMRRHVADISNIADTANTAETASSGAGNNTADAVDRARPASRGRQTGPRKIAIEKSLRNRHTFICGATGSGKTQAAVAMVTEELRQGASLLMIEQKADTIAHVLDAARRVGIPTARISLLIPEGNALVPRRLLGFDPLQTGIAIEQAAGDLASVLTSLTASSGVRLEDVLINTLIILAAHRLSLAAVPGFLSDSEIRHQTFARPVTLPDETAYRAARDFFEAEFDRWSPSERAKTIAPVILRVREVLRNPTLRAVFCADRQDIDLKALWSEQRVVIVQIDRTSLGELGVRLLSTLFVSILFRTALRHGAQSRRQVLLMLDELVGISRFASGQTLSDVLVIARSYHLQLLGIVQSLELLEDNLRVSMLANAAVQMFFRLSFNDSRYVAASLAAGAGNAVHRLHLRLAARDRGTGLPERVGVSAPVLDATGRTLQLARTDWKSLQWTSLLSPDGGLQQLEQVARRSGVGGLFVRCPDGSGVAQIDAYLRGLRPGEWYLHGPAPLTVVVTVPRVTVTRTERRSEADLQQQFSKGLMHLPVQSCILRLPGREPQGVRVVDVSPLPTTHPALAAYIAAAATPPRPAVAQTASQPSPTRPTVPGTPDAPVDTPTAPQTSGTARHPNPTTMTQENADDGSLR